MTPIILPEGIVSSWCSALARPDLRHWSSLAIALSNAWATCSIDHPDSPMLDDLRCLSDLAYQHMRDQMPVPEMMEEAA